MNEGSAWRGPWKVRIRERLQARGYGSLTAFAEARPTASLVALAEELGKDDIAGAQVFSVLVDEATRNHRLTRLVRGQLVRELVQCLPDGWPAEMDDAHRFKIAKALGFWSSFTPESHQHRVEQARAVLRATPPPPGWRPLGPDDELLLALLPDEET